MNDSTLNKITIEIQLNNRDRLMAKCLELNCESEINQIGEILDPDFDDQITGKMIEIIDSNPDIVSSFIKAYFGGENEWEKSIKELKHHKFIRQLQESFLKSYPNADKYISIDFMPIPYIQWDGGDNYENELERQQLGYQGLINNGKDDKDWIDFIQWICPILINSYVSSQRKQKYKEWIQLGFPLPSFEQIINLQSNHIPNQE